MDPTSAGAAAIQGLGRIGAAAVRSYTPMGVARVGSREDRAQAYRRLLDATAQHRLALRYVASLKEAGEHPLVAETLSHLMATSTELLCALQGVQLCAPGYVINPAQALCDGAQLEAEAQNAFPPLFVAFLEAARQDLDYNPKRWQLRAKRKFGRNNSKKVVRLAQSKAVNTLPE